MHFARNPENGDLVPEDRLFKIRPVIEYFNRKITTIYSPGQNLSLDESMVLWRGRLSFRQYIKNKRHKYGVKLYMVTEPNGIILKFAVYTGQLDVIGGKGHATKIVLHLMEERLGMGHSLYLDNFYNSYDLAIKLLNRQTFCTGTLRIDRKNIPEDVKTAKLKRSETIFRYSNEGVLVGKWRDKRDVTYISTEFDNDMVTYHDKLNRVKEKPKPIYMYNKYMGGIDRQDQFMSYYPIERKTLRWYRKLGIHIFQMLLLNAYLLFKNSTNSRMSFYDFRLSIIGELVPEKTAIPQTLTEKNHLPKKNPAGPTGKVVSRRCTWCYNHNNKKRRDTSYHCPACTEKPYLCLNNCFDLYHRNIH